MNLEKMLLTFENLWNTDLKNIQILITPRDYDEYPQGIIIENIKQSEILNDVVSTYCYPDDILLWRLIILTTSGEIWYPANWINCPLTKEDKNRVTLTINSNDKRMYITFPNSKYKSCSMQLLKLEDFKNNIENSI